MQRLLIGGLARNRRRLLLTLGADPASLVHARQQSGRITPIYSDAQRCAAARFIQGALEQHRQDWQVIRQ